jgi:hypothetical protein
MVESIKKKENMGLERHGVEERVTHFPSAPLYKDAHEDGYHT